MEPGEVLSFLRVAGSYSLSGMPTELAGALLLNNSLMPRVAFPQPSAKRIWSPGLGFLADGLEPTVRHQFNIGDGVTERKSADHQRRNDN
ncbi:MAG: hypothetical protein IPG74_09075 [Flavobacteriales bacterium]|nr:hypothetical protein [Flavobacteriales bacterium]